MAAATRTVGTWSGVHFDVNYDDVTMLISSVTVVNDNRRDVDLVVSFQGAALVDKRLAAGEQSFDLSALGLKVGLVDHQLPTGWSYSIVLQPD